MSPTRALDAGSNPELVKAAGIPENYTLQCAIIIGHPAAENKFSVAERVQKGSVNYID
jgi:hypothetical protein